MESIWLQIVPFIVFWVVLIFAAIRKAPRLAYYGTLIGGSVILTFVVTLFRRNDYDGFEGLFVFFFLALIALAGSVVLSVIYEIRNRDFAVSTTSLVPGGASSHASLKWIALGSLGLSVITAGKYYAQYISRGYYKYSHIYDFFSDSALISGIVLMNMVLLVISIVVLFFAHKRKAGARFLVPFLIPGIVINIGYLILNN